ncbi:MAG: spermidine/putrescine transport system ATP-binding protein [Frankiaceae bacterium]|jgi:spermidine/putrescine transport system ATP-binding protein|nr:spermidine/putrescine transport system ATP-binding protein [Frankiaceae bacterium]
MTPTAGAPAGDLRLVELTKDFGSAVAVDCLSLTIPAGSFFALLGPSGCGKTTTLRMVAGLEEPTSGRIYLGDDDVTDRKAYKRPVNTVFQNYALFPHLNVFDNIAFGLRRRGVKDVKAQVDRMLDVVELQGFGVRRPSQLSGGQQQRIALARALINTPQVLLLDEPLGALDLKLRRQMQLELKRIQTDVGLTFVHVTHDQEEAMTMADTIAVMNNGKIEQLGSPVDLYENPSTVFVANFLGQSNLVAAQIVGTQGADLLLDVQGRKLTMPAARNCATGDSVYVGVRPEKVRLVPAGASVDLPGHNVLDGVVIDASYTGVTTQYVVRMAWGQDLMVIAANVGNEVRLTAGANAHLVWDASDTFGLEATGDIAEGIETIDEAGS